MSEINKYEITTLHGKHEQKHIIHALTAQDAITQFKVKIDCDIYKIVNIEPYQQVFTGEEIIARMNLHKELTQKWIQMGIKKPTSNSILSFLKRISK